MAAPRARAEIRAETRKYRQDLKRAEKDTKKFAKQAKSSLISGFKGGFGAVAGLATAGGIADVGGDVIAFEKSLARLGTQASGSANLDEIRTAANQMRDELGLSRNEALEAAVQLTNFLGGSAATAENLRVLSHALVGTGAEMEDLAGLAQVMNQQFGLTDPQQLADGLSSFIAVGKKGSVPLKDMAKVAKQSAAVFKRMGGEGVEGTSQLAAALQIGEQAFGTPAEAATGLKAMVEGLASATVKVPQLRKSIGQVGTEKFIGLEGALDQLAESKFFKDERLFQKAFPSAPARTMIRALIENRKQFDEFSDAGKQGAKNALVFGDAEDFVAGRGGQLQLQMARLRGKIEDLFTPERIDKLVKGAELLADALGFVVDNIELLVLAYGTYKALQIASIWSKEAAAAKKLASAQGVLANAYGETRNSAAGISKTTQALGFGGKILGGVGALAMGVEAGLLIDEQFGVAKKLNTAMDGLAEDITGMSVTDAFSVLAGGQTRAQKAAEKKRILGLAPAADAAAILTDIGAIDEGGKIRPELVQSLRRSEVLGRELTVPERLAQTVLGGGLQTAAGKRLVTEEGTAFGGFFGALQQLQGFTPEQFQRESAARAAENERIIAAIEKLADRPSEIIVDGDKLITAQQRTQRNRRSPAP